MSTDIIFELPLTITDRDWSADQIVVREELAPAPGSSGVSSREGLEEGSDDDTQELCEPSQQQAEVIAGSGENSVDAVAE
ncbi:hypothetical protein, partial [Bradyrhizobium elkanii]|uniref:hypothetical protein n=1 Tax=Bradyrhizobium elkanii TaxID=29448 RepID=UPI00159F14AC